MTICEYIRNEYIKYIALSDEEKVKFGGIITAEKETYKYFKVFCRNICGGGMVDDLKAAGITYKQLEKAVADKYMKRGMLKTAGYAGAKEWFELTEKGIKTIYDYYTAKGWQTATPTMSKEVFDKLVSLCNEYDEHIEYIDDGRQYREAERNNRRVKAEFAEIASQYGDMKMPAGAFRFRGAESKESILKKHFAEYGVVVK